MTKDRFKKEAKGIVARKLAEASAEIVKIATSYDFCGPIGEELACLWVQISASVGIFPLDATRKPLHGVDYQYLEGSVMTSSDLLENLPKKGAEQ